MIRARTKPTRAKASPGRGLVGSNNVVAGGRNTLACDSNVVSGRANNDHDDDDHHPEKTHRAGRHNKGKGKDENAGANNDNENGNAGDNSNAGGRRQSVRLEDRTGGQTTPGPSGSSRARPPSRSTRGGNQRGARPTRELLDQDMDDYFGR